MPSELLIEVVSMDYTYCSALAQVEYVPITVPSKSLLTSRVIVTEDLGPSQICLCIPALHSGQRNVYSCQVKGIPCGCRWREMCTDGSGGWRRKACVRSTGGKAANGGWPSSHVYPSIAIVSGPYQRCQCMLGTCNLNYVKRRDIPALM